MWSPAGLPWPGACAFHEGGDCVLKQVIGAKGVGQETTSGLRGWNNPVLELARSLWVITWGNRKGCPEESGHPYGGSGHGVVAV